MAISFVNAISNSRTGAGLLTFSVPVGAAAGDLLFVAIATEGSLVTLPAGWIRVTGQTEGGGGFDAEYLGHFLTAGDPASFSFDMSDDATGSMLVYNGVDPMGVPLFAEDGGEPSTSHQSPSVFPAIPDWLLISAFAFASPHTAASLQVTERTDISAVSNGVAVGDEIIPLGEGEIGPSGTRSCTITTSAEASRLTVLVPPKIGELGYFTGGVIDGFASSTEQLARDASAIGLQPTSSGGVVEVRYRMRAFDQGLGRTVYWTSNDIDPTGASYSGPGPLIDVVVSTILCEGA